MISLFSRKADELAQLFAVNNWAKHLFLLICAISVVILYGYYFGTFDQASHIPFLKKTLDSSLFPNDAFFNLRFSHFSYFWLIFAPFMQSGILEVTMFVVHVVSIYATFWAIWELAMFLFKDPLTSFVCCIVFLFPHIGFSGFPLFEFSMLNRTVVLPIELFALVLYLRKHKYIPFVILGLLYNLHAISVHFFAGMVFFDLLVRTKKEGIIPFIRSLALFVLAAIPVLIWKFGHSGIPLTPNYEWFDILNRAVFSHLFSLYNAHNAVVGVLTLSGITSVVLFFRFSKTYRGPHHDSVRNWFIAGIIACSIQYMATYIYPVPILIQTQILRIGVLMIFFTYLYITAVFVKKYREKVLSDNHFFLIITSLIFSFSPLVFVLAWAVFTYRPNLLRITTLTLMTVMGGVLTAMAMFELWKPGFYIFPQNTPFAQVQRWAKNNTPKNAVFITPPEEWWMYETEWRVLSERSSVVTWSELLEAAFDPNYLSYWKPRFEDVAPGAIQKFRGNFFENKKIIRDAYYSHTPDQLKTIAHTYNASYLVVEKQFRYPFKQVYVNTTYTVYEIPPVTLP